MSNMRTHQHNFFIIVLVSVWFVFFGGGQRAVWAEVSGTLKSGLTRYHSDKWVVLPKAAESDGELSITVDGRLDDSAWSQAETMNGFKTAYFERPVDHIEYKLTYDDFYLYVGGTMSLEEAESLHKIDVILKPSPTRTFYYVASIPISDSHPESKARLNTIWNPTGSSLSSDVGRVDLPVSSTGRTHVSGVMYDVNEDDSSFYVEVAIPLGFVSASGASPGDEWQLNIAHVHHLYTKPLTSWIPVRHSNQWDTGHSERGASVRVIANVIGEGRTGSVFFSHVPDYVTPSKKAKASQDDLQLTYVDFTHKDVHWSLTGPSDSVGDVVIRWQSPDQSWQTLTTTEIQRDGTFLAARIAHPEPMDDGLYKLMVQYEDSQGDVLTSLVAFDREYLVEAGLDVADSPVPSSALRQVQWAEASERVQDVMSIIPPQPGHNFSGLPERPGLDPREGLFKIGPDLRSLVATSTGTTYLGDAPDFQPNKAMPFIDGKRDASSYPYYEGEDGRAYHLVGLLWSMQKSHVVSEAINLASSDPLGAARILYALAQAFDGWHPFAQQRASWFARPAPVGSGPPYPYWGGLWTHFWWNELSAIDRLASAYASVKRTNAFELLSEEMDEDVEKKVLEEMILKSIDLTLSQPPGRGNLASRPWIGLIRLARTLDDPDFVHRAVDMIDKYLAESRFLFDGFWYEISASYHHTIVSGLDDALKLLRGWTDPEGYVSPRTGMRFDDLDMGKQYPFLNKADEFIRTMVYPNGNMLPLTDTWPGTRVSNARIDTGPFLLPAAKLARMTSGTGPNQTQLNVNFQPKYGHVHRDGINFTLYADGRELIPDIGYSLSKYRWYVTSTMSHNTVVVDSSEMSVNNHSRDGGNIETFVTSPLFQQTRVGYDRAYASVREYARELWYVPFSTGDKRESYILDIFRVEGGRRHEYTLQGDANRDAVFDTDLSTSFYGPYLLPEGVKVTEPTSNSDSGSAEGHYPGYIYVRDVDRADALGNKFTLDLLVNETGVDVPRLRITGLLEDDGNELYLGRSPSLRLGRLRGSGSDDNHSVEQYTMPKMVLRREGSNLRSDFVTVLEPYYGDERSQIDVIERLPVDSGPKGAVAVQIMYGDTTDIILSNPHDEEGPLVSGDMELHGESGFIRLRDGIIHDVQIVGGTLLRKGEHEFIGRGRVSGTVVDTWREVDGDEMNAIVVDSDVSVDASGDYVIVTHPDGSTMGFEIGSIRRDGDRTIIRLAEYEPGFIIEEDGASRQPFYPWKQWRGEHTFHITYIDEQTNVPIGDVKSEGAGSVSGVVHDALGHPFAGATIHPAGFSSVATVSDDQGRFHLTDVPHGKQWIKVSHELYESVVSGPLDINEADISDMRLALIDRRPPTLTMDTGEVEAGDTISVTSNTVSTIYLLRGRRAAASTETALERVALLKEQATAHEPTLLTLGSDFEGDYVLYAADEEGRVSKGVSFSVRNVEREEQLLDLFDAWMGG